VLQKDMSLRQRSIAVACVLGVAMVNLTIASPAIARDDYAGTFVGDDEATVEFALSTSGTHLRDFIAVDFPVLAEPGGPDRSTGGVIRVHPRGRHTFYTHYVQNDAFLECGRTWTYRIKARLFSDGTARGYFSERFEVPEPPLTNCGDQPEHVTGKLRWEAIRVKDER
jgi:hypothetical protein